MKKKENKTKNYKNIFKKTNKTKQNKNKTI